MTASDGPFGAAPDIGIGFSDAALLTVSLAGFGFLAVTIYSIVLQRLKSREDLKAEEEAEGSYEDQLAHANVATLSRAQRRARARQIMKQQRRAFPAGAGDAPGAEQQPQQQQPAAADGGQMMMMIGNNQDENHQEDDDATSNQPVLSRKERQRLAKLAEKEERKLLEQERKQQQEEAQKHAKQAKLERLEAQARQQEEKRQQDRIRHRQAEEAKQRAWETFLILGSNGSSKADLSAEPNNNQKVLLVKDWLEQCQRNRFVNIQALADKFSVPLDTVQSRIQQLVREQRVNGVFDPSDPTLFVVFGESELQSLAQTIRTKGCQTATEIAEWMTQTAAASNELPCMSP